MQIAKVNKEIPVCVCGLGFIITFFFYQQVLSSLNERDNIRLTSISKDLENRLSTAVNVITYGLGGANGVFAASKSVEHNEFHAYVSSRDLPKEFPGSLGFGFIEKVERDNISKFLNSVRADEQPDFELKTSGNHSDLLVIKFLEPTEINKNVIGYDIGSDPVRREAAELAMLSGKPTLTKKIQLLQSTKEESGFLFLKPVYYNGSLLKTIEQRRRSIHGWVFAPFTLRQIVEPVLNHLNQSINLNIFEGDSTEKKNLIYSSQEEDYPSHNKRVLKLFIGQQLWTVVVEPKKLFFEQDTSRYLPLVLSFTGALLSVLFGLVTWIYLGIKQRALALRIQATEDESRKTKNILGSLIDNLPVGIFLKDGRKEHLGTIRLWNKACENIFGISNKEILNCADSDFFPKEQTDLLRAIDNQVFKEKVSIDVAEIKVLSRTQGLRLLHMVKIPFFDFKGEPEYLLGYCEDITERRRTEVALLTSEKEFKSAFEYASIGMALVGLDGQWLKVNQPLLKLVGYSQEELLQKTFQEITHPDDLNKDLSFMQQVLVNKIETYELEKRYFHKEGHIIWVLLSVSLVKDEEGKPRYFISQIQDINCRKKIEEELAEANSLNLAILNNAGYAIISGDKDFVIHTFNPAAEQMLGYKATEIIGKTPEIFHDPNEVVERALQLSKELGRHVEPGHETFTIKSKLGQHNEHEWTYIRKDGRRIPILLSVTSLINASGEITGFLGMAADISLQMQLREQINDREMRLQAFIEHAPAAVAMLDKNLCYIAYSKRWLSDYKLGEQDITGMSHYDVFPEINDTWKQIHQRILAGAIEKNDEELFVRTDGVKQWIKWEVRPWFTGSGDIGGIAMLTEDVTVRKLLLEDLRIAKQSADTATGIKSQFLANMSHEIRTPLTSIIGYTDSLISDQLTIKEEQMALNTVLRNGNHLLRIINDILDFSKIEAGKLDVEMLDVSLFEIISDVGNLMHHKAIELGISFGFNYEFPLPRILQTDPTRLKQILINLVGNALKFTEQGGVKVVISFDASAELLTFSIIDTGVGMTPDQRGKLFQAFTQADTSTTREFGGTGLGLVISYELACKLGGGISVTSVKGQGSTFSLTIRTGAVNQGELVYSKPKSIRNEDTAPVKQPSLSGKILLAEDGPDNQKLLLFILNKANIDCVLVENGALAIEAVKKETFDLILMDMQMPVMDGYTATKKLRELGYKVPIVALTANIMKQDITRCLDAGCTSFLGKPFERNVFFQKLAEYLESKPPEASIEGSNSIFSESVSKEERSLIVSFVRRLPERMADIRAKLHAEDWKQLAMLAHRLRGADMFGYPSLGKAATTIENAVMTGAYDQIPHHIDQVAEICNQIAEGIERE